MMDWEDVKTFVAVARNGSVRSAATALSVHHATVGRRIARLEASTGVLLFNRRPDGFELTQMGEELLEVAESTALNFTQIERRIAGRDDQPAGVVTASLGEPIATALIAPGVPQFRADNPGIDLRINASWEREDLSRGKADVVIRVDNNPQDSLFGKRLFRYAEAIYGSEALLANWQAGRRDDVCWIGWGGDGVQRPTWVERTEYGATQSWGGFPDVNIQVALASAGVGLIALPCFVGDCAPALRRAPGLQIRPIRDIWLLTHADLRRTRRVRIVMEFFEARMKQHRALIEGRCPDGAIADGLE